ncbi:hypothetical protein NDU88_005730 [Pleurodeles waltl]|uniref:Uncharacterized protein n=1 Tax=Pleurodeles waltl TaxID=8319 RepID=A0AAV7QM40_PLEWA|nr:hypothetical protein NDU88_005730 [Pleurodeles waltl]
MQLGIHTHPVSLNVESGPCTGPLEPGNTLRPHATASPHRSHSDASETHRALLHGWRCPPANQQVNTPSNYCFQKLWRYLNPWYQLRPHPPSSAASSADPCSDAATERILQEIVAAGRCLEAMDSKITDLSTAATAIRTDIANVQDRITDLNHHLTNVEGQLATLPGRDSELQFLRIKITDLDNRSQRNNISFFGIPEHKEGSDVRAFLRDFLPELMRLIFSPSLEFQRAHRIAPPPNKANAGKPVLSSHAFYAVSKPPRL